MSHQFIQYSQDTTKSAYKSLKDFACKFLGICPDGQTYPTPKYYDAIHQSISEENA